MAAGAIDLDIIPRCTRRVPVYRIKTIITIIVIVITPSLWRGRRATRQHDRRSETAADIDRGNNYYHVAAVF